jgi:hypothetical protein
VEEVYPMSDKMLMEDWRKYLAEKEVLEEAWPSIKRAEFGNPKFRERTALQKFKAIFQKKWKQKEEISDNLIKALGTKQPWEDIFTLADNKDRPKYENFSWKNIFEHYGIEPTIEWEAVVLFVLVCREADQNETGPEIVDAMAEAVGAGNTLPSQVGGIMGAWAGLSLGPEAGALSLGALLGLSGGTLWAIAGVGALAASLGYLKGVVKEMDTQKISQGLENIPGEFRLDAVKNLDNLEVFHHAEFEILRSLVDNPTELPKATPSELYRDVQKSDVDESKFHDDWRDYLLTEEKL